MLIPHFHSKMRLARLLDVDPRTISLRIRKLNISPVAIAGRSRELFDDNALEQLRLKEAR